MASSSSLGTAGQTTGGQSTTAATPVTTANHVPTVAPPAINARHVTTESTFEVAWAPSRALQNSAVVHALWGGVAFVVIITIAIATTDNSDSTNWPHARQMSDPMVFTHILALIPIFLAIDKGMPLLAGILASSTIMSFFYHLFNEEETSSVLMDLDVLLSNVTVFCMVVLFLVTLTLPHSNRTMIVITVILAIMSMVCYYGSVDGDTEQDMCRRHRMHPLWHCLAYLTSAAVIWNFNRDPATTLFSRRASIRSIQTFTF